MFTESTKFDDEKFKLENLKMGLGQSDEGINYYFGKYKRYHINISSYKPTMDRGGIYKL